MAGQFRAKAPAPQGQPTLRINLLGPPDVWWGDGPVVIPRRQVRALLFHLATRLQPVPRERVLYLFWPDSPETIARRQLTHLLTHLRRSLPAGDLLECSHERIGLSPDGVWSDTVEFLAAIEGAPASASLSTRLEQAIRLYRGPFLAGFSLPDCGEFEAWMTAEQRAFERLYLDGLLRLIDNYSASGEYVTAIQCANQYLVLDDLAEEVHRRLIELYTMAGDRVAASRQFERCVTTLERELGTDPLPETRAAYQASQAARSLPRPAMIHRPEWATLPSLVVPLVGRSQAMALLSKTWERSRAGGGQAVLISGEPGIGKSRLMQEFAGQLHGEALILAGAGQSSTRTTPYVPVVEALMPPLEGVGTAIPLAEPWLSEAARLLPGLKVTGLAQSKSPPADADRARGQLFEALRRLLQALSTPTGATILCLDDLPWCDGATLDWLSFMARHLRWSRLLVIGTYRSEDAAALCDLRGVLSRASVLSEVQLAGLDERDVMEILHHLEPGMRVDRLVIGRLQRATGGNPFFLLETLRALIETGKLGEGRLPTVLPLADSVRQTVRLRLERLSPVGRQVIEAAAVLGANFDFETLWMTAGRGEMDTMDALDELTRRQLLIEYAGGYRFVHELSQRTVEAGMSPGRRQLLHRRAGEALERLRPHEIASLAWHFDAGGKLGSALTYHNQAAAQAESVYAWKEAETHHGRILELCAHKDPRRADAGLCAQRGHTLAERAHLRYLQGRLEERDADLRQLIELSEDGGDVELRLQAIAHHTRYLNLDGRYREAIARSEEALTILSVETHSENAGDAIKWARLRSRFLSQIGFAHYFLGQPQPAMKALQAALTLAGEHTDPESRGRILHVLGYVYFHFGDFHRSLECQSEAYACHLAVGDENRVAWDSLDIGSLCLEIGWLDQAREHLREGLALSRRIGARPAEAYGLTQMGCFELHQGHYLAARERFEEALALQQTLRNPQGCAAAEIGAGLACCQLGDLEPARGYLSRATERASALGHRRRLAEALVGLGIVELASGDYHRALDSLSHAAAVAAEAECHESQCAALSGRARALRLAAADMAMALASAEEAIKEAGALPLTTCRMWGEMEAGLCHLALGQACEAFGHTHRAVELIPLAHQAWFGAECVHLAHAATLVALGRPAEASEQERIASAIITAKADCIDDPARRRRYLAAAPGRR